MHVLRRTLALAFTSAFLLAPCLLRAQAGTSGLVTGSVTDASGAVIPGIAGAGVPGSAAAVPYAYAPSSQ